jgi:hypothetical protein
VYARLVADCQRAEDPYKAREKLDEELYAPLGGWEAADRRLWAAVMSASEAEG